MTLTSAGFFASRSRAGWRKPGRGRLRLEVLEDRCAPATLTVTTASDQATHTGTSLRDAVATANGDANGGQSDTIIFATGLNGQTTTLSQGLLELSGKNGATPAVVTIDGGSQVTVDGNNASAIFQVDSGVQAGLTGLTLQRGSAAHGGAVNNAGTLAVANSTLRFNSVGATGRGAALYNTGVLTVTDATLSSNFAFGFNSHGSNGGAIYNQGGTLMVTRATLSANTAGYGDGGGLYNDLGTVTLNNTTLSGNSATNAGTGGGIFNTGTLTVNSSALNFNSTELFPGGGISNAGTLTVNNSTLNSNSGSQGGGIYNTGTVTVNNSTLESNVANQAGGIYTSGTATLTDTTLGGNFGGGIFHTSGSTSAVTLTLRNCTVSDNRNTGNGLTSTHLVPVRLQSTIIAGNDSGSPSTPDIGAVVTSDSSYNLIGRAGIDLSGISNGDSNHNLVGSIANPLDARLAPIGLYGGSTRTFVLLPGSPALGKGDPATTASTDQRGLPRQREGQVDIGAVQSQGFTLTPLPSDSASTPVGTAFALSVLLTANDPGLSDFTGGTLNLAVTPAVNGASAKLGSGTTVALNSNRVYPLDISANGTAGSYTLAVDSGAGSATFHLSNVASRLPAALSGRVYLDLNGNGVSDPGKPGVGGVTVFLDFQASTRPGLGALSAVTDASGRYSFPGLVAGSYVVRLDPTAPGITSTSPALTVSLNGADVGGNDLGAVLFSPVAPVPVNADLFGGSNPDADTAFVRGLYHAILGRDANGQISDGSGHTISEIRYQVSQLQAGLSRTALAEQIVNSVEHRGLEVNSYYRTFLHRDLAAQADPSAGYWLNQLLSGAGEAAVVQGILDSPEYQAAHVDDVVLVRDLYIQVLGRAAGDAEVNQWVGMLNAGAKRSAVERLVLLSQESSQRQVNGFYVAWLHHLPPAGDNLWVDRLSSGLQSAGEVTASILGDPFSQEFYLLGKASVTG
jgi:hypothetical protein